MPSSISITPCTLRYERVNQERVAFIIWSLCDSLKLKWLASILPRLDSELLIIALHKWPSHDYIEWVFQILNWLLGFRVVVEEEVLVDGGVLGYRGECLLLDVWCGLVVLHGCALQRWPWWAQIILLGGRCCSAVLSRFLFNFGATHTMVRILTALSWELTSLLIWISRLFALSAIVARVLV